MATFQFNKLVRDKLKAEYEKINQKATYRSLSKDEFANALKQKLLEEVNEIDTSDKDSIKSELADVYQVIDDLIALYELDKKDIETLKITKLTKKGGFAQATFVETLELSDDDEWNEYYRKQPDVFKEIDS